MTRRRALNVIGPFYVEDGCCTGCGVPQIVAPELFSKLEGDSQCHVVKQPATPDELDAMVRVFEEQDLDCIRYAGDDPAILRRLVENGDGRLCDAPLPAGVTAMRRDHVTFAMREPGWAPRALLERFAAYVASWRATEITDAGSRIALVAIAWHAEDFHQIELQARADDFVMRHAGPVALGRAIHDWLTSDPLVEAIAWRTKDQYDTDGPSQRTPW